MFDESCEFCRNPGKNEVSTTKYTRRLCAVSFVPAAMAPSMLRVSLYVAENETKTLPSEIAVSVVGGTKFFSAAIVELKGYRGSVDE